VPSKTKESNSFARTPTTNPTALNSQSKFDQALNWMVRNDYLTRETKNHLGEVATFLQNVNRESFPPEPGRNLVCAVSYQCGDRIKKSRVEACPIGYLSNRDFDFVDVFQNSCVLSELEQQIENDLECPGTKKLEFVHSRDLNGRKTLDCFSGDKACYGRQPQDSEHIRLVSKLANLAQGKIGKVINCGASVSCGCKSENREVVKSNSKTNWLMVKGCVDSGFAFPKDRDGWPNLKLPQSRLTDSNPAIRRLWEQLREKTQDICQCQCPPGTQASVQIASQNLYCLPSRDPVDQPCLFSSVDTLQFTRTGKEPARKQVPHQR